MPFERLGDRENDDRRQQEEHLVQQSGTGEGMLYWLRAMREMHKLLNASHVLLPGTTVQEAQLQEIAAVKEEIERAERELLLKIEGDVPREIAEILKDIAEKNADEKPLDLHVSARVLNHINKALGEMMHALLEERMALWCRYHSTDRASLAKNAGYSDADTMATAIVLDAVSDMFRHLASMEAVPVQPKELERFVDERLGFGSDTLHDEKAYEQPPAYVEKAVVQVVHDVAADILSSISEHESMSPDQFALEFAGYGSGEALVGAATQEIAEELLAKFKKLNALALDASIIRHSIREFYTGCIATRQLILGAQDVEQAPVVSMSSEEQKGRIAMHIRQHTAHQRARASLKVHRPLPAEDRLLLERLSIRLAGYDRSGSPLPSMARDIALFRHIEGPLVTWSQSAKEAVVRAKEEGREIMEDPAVSAALQNFHTQGGHAELFTPEQIAFIAHHGIIAFLELQIRSDLSVVIGSVSALSRTPCSHGAIEDQWHRSAASLFSLYDVQNVSFPYSDEERLNEAVFSSEQVFICRSSVLSVLSSSILQPQLGGEALPPAWEGKSLRRIGAAARGKMEVLGVATTLKNQQDLGFNIGTVKGPADRTFSMGNVPSQGHNSWMTPFSWVGRRTPIAEGIEMFWTHYRGKIRDGFSAFMGEGGILREKGYDLDAVWTSIERSARQIRQCIADGSHAPW